MVYSFKVESLGVRVWNSGFSGVEWRNQLYGRKRSAKALASIRDHGQFYVEGHLLKDLLRSMKAGGSCRSSVCKRVRRIRHVQKAAGSDILYRMDFDNLRGRKGGPQL